MVKRKRIESGAGDDSCAGKRKFHEYWRLYLYSYLVFKPFCNIKTHLWHSCINESVHDVSFMMYPVADTAHNH